MPILVLTLPGSETRRAPLESSLQQLGLEYELLDGVDGRHGLPAEYESQVDRRAARWHFLRDLTDAEFACALSHQAAYGRILDNGWRNAVILEDDAVVGTAFREFVLTSPLPAADLVMLDHWKARVWRFGARRLGGELIARRPMRPPMLTTGYRISARGARIIRSRSFPISRQADWPCELRGIRTYILDPRIVGHPDQEDGESWLRTHRSELEQRSSARMAARKRNRSLAMRLGRPFTLRFWSRILNRPFWYRLTDREALDI